MNPGLGAATLLGLELALFASIATRKVRDAKNHGKRYENHVDGHNVLLVSSRLSRAARLSADYGCDKARNSWSMPGARMTTRSSGKIQNTSGNRSLMGALRAFSSARWRRRVRSESE